MFPKTAQFFLFVILSHLFVVECNSNHNDGGHSNTLTMDSKSSGKQDKEESLVIKHLEEELDDIKYLLRQTQQELQSFLMEESHFQVFDAICALLPCNFL